MSQDLPVLVDRVLGELGDRIEDKYRHFARRVFANGTTAYERRLAQYAFIGHARVLDAGCGFGQWSLALARHNRQVAAVDVSPARIAALRALAGRLSVDNLTALSGSIDALPFRSASFDAVFCYGVIFLTPWREALRELVRVLAPGGRLYVNANGLGWYKFLWFTEHNRGSGYEPKEVAAKVLLNTLRYHRGDPIERGADILIDPDELTAELRSLDCAAIEIAAEGSAARGTYRGPVTPPFFIGEYRGERGVYEILASKGRKTDVAPSGRISSELVDAGR